MTVIYIFDCEIDPKITEGTVVLKQSVMKIILKCNQLSTNIIISTFNYQILFKIIIIFIILLQGWNDRAWLLYENIYK